MQPQMLTLLRESRGYSGARLATMTGIPQPTLSRIENGLASIDDDRMKLIADALGYPVEAFNWTDPVYGFGSAAFYHRKQQTLPQTALRRIQAEVNLTRMRLERLMRSIEVDAQHELPHLVVEEFGGPAEVARAVRATWRLPMGPVRDVATVLELAGVLVLRYPFESPRISAISLDNVAAYPALIILNSSMPADRERFTLAHELGHLVMHTTITAPEEAEREADSFASEFLMPAAEIRTQLKGITLERAAQLKPVWKVSMGALIRRAKDLGVIDDRRYKSLNVSISQKGWRKVEPVDVDRDKPSVLGATLNIHLREHGYSVEELAKVAAMRPEEFAARFDLELGSADGRRLRVVK